MIPASTKGITSYTPTVFKNRIVCPNEDEIQRLWKRKIYGNITKVTSSGNKVNE